MRTSEKGPWRLVRVFERELADRLNDDLVSVYAVGRLAQNARPEMIKRAELSIVVAGERPSERVEGEIEAAKVAAFETARAHGGSTGGVEAIDCVVLAEGEMTSPFSAERETAPEVLRLHDEGVRIGGVDVRERWPRPSYDDFVAYIRHFDQLVRSTAFRTDSNELPPHDTLYRLAAIACRHLIFATERILIWPDRDALIAFRMSHDTNPSIEVVDALLRLGPAPESDDVGTELGPKIADFWRRVHEEIADAPHPV